MPGSCSSGFRSRPSAGAGSSRSNGLDVVSRKSRKPIDTKPSTPSTRLRTCMPSVRPKPATAPVHTDSISAHSSIEPSCEPQVAAMR